MARAVNETEQTRRATEGALLDVRTSCGGEIVSFDPATFRATIRPAVRRVLTDSDSDRELDTPENLEGVPIMFPRFGPFFLYAPLPEGSPVRVEFCEEDEAAFYGSTEPAPVNPEIYRKFGAFCVAYPAGFRAAATPLGTENPSRPMLGTPGGAVITWDDFLHLGGHTTDPANRVLRVADIDALFAAWVPVAMDGGASLVARWGSVKSSVGAGKVRAV